MFVVKLNNKGGKELSIFINLNKRIWLPVVSLAELLLVMSE